MGMIYRISEMSREVNSGKTYMLVDFWQSQGAFDRGSPPYLTNDFIVGFNDKENSRTILDGIIRKYWEGAQAHGFSGDNTADVTKRLFRKGIYVRQRVTPMFVRDTADNGVIERQVVKDMVGVTR